MFITSIIAIFGTNALTQWYKKAQTTYGDTKIHAFMFMVALAFSAGYSIVMANPNLLLIAKHIGVIFAGAVTSYAVIFKQLGKILSPITIDPSNEN